MNECIMAHVSFIPKNLKYLVDKHLVIDRFEFDGTITTWYFFEETDNHYIVPRHFPEFINAKYRLNLKLKYVHYPSERIDFNLHAEPRDIEQLKVVRFLSDVSNRSGIVKAPPGFGKTVCTIMAIHRLKRKTLILVPKKSLAQQWKEEIHRFTDLTDKDVPIFQDGIITKEKLDNMKIGIGVSHTFSYKSLRKDIKYHELMKNAKIDTVIFDECHSIIPTQFFFFQNSLLYANRFFGLSATPYHKDKRLENIIYYTVSDNIIDVSTYKLKPLVVELIFNSYIPEKTKRYIMWNNRFDIHKYLRMLKKHSNIFKGLFKQFVHKTISSNRRLLILAPQKKFLQYLFEILTNEMQIDKSIGLFWSGRSKDELNSDIILATTQIFNMGLSISDLNTLLLIDILGSKKWIEQIMGRILRKDTGKRPIVTILNDAGFEIFSEMRERRIKIYKQLGFEYQVIEL